MGNIAHRESSKDIFFQSEGTLFSILKNKLGKAPIPLPSTISKIRALFSNFQKRAGESSYYLLRQVVP